MALESRDESQVAEMFVQMSIFLSTNKNKFFMLKAMLQSCEIERNTYIDKIHTSNLLIMFFITYRSLQHRMNALNIGIQKMSNLQRKEASNKKNVQNKPTVKYNFT